MKHRFRVGTAVREFLLIVVGVLTALAVDQYMEEREERRFAQYHLERLAQDLRATEEQSQFLLRQITQSERAAAAIVEILRGSNLSYDGSGLVVALTRAAAHNTPGIRDVAFLEINQGVSLRFVEPPELRSRIVEYYQIAAGHVTWFDTMDLRARTLARELVHHELFYEARTACPIDEIREPLTCRPALDPNRVDAVVRSLRTATGAVEIYNSRAFELTRARERVAELILQTTELLQLVESAL